jgi:hypothetical protein
MAVTCITATSAKMTTNSLTSHTTMVLTWVVVSLGTQELINNASQEGEEPIEDKVELEVEAQHKGNELRSSFVLTLAIECVKESRDLAGSTALVLELDRHCNVLWSNVAYRAHHLAIAHVDPQTPTLARLIVTLTRTDMTTCALSAPHAHCLREKHGTGPNTHRLREQQLATTHELHRAQSCPVILIHYLYTLMTEQHTPPHMHHRHERSTIPPMTSQPLTGMDDMMPCKRPCW